MHSPQVAAFLLNPHSRRYLTAFLGRARSASEVAAELGVGVSALTYRIAQMRRLGLLRIERSEPRRGRPVRYYRAASAHYFVPYAAQGDVRALSSRQQSEVLWQDRLLRGLEGAQQAFARQAGLHLYWDGQVDCHVDAWCDGRAVRPLSGTVPALSAWADLRLSGPELRELHEELCDLFDRYTGRHSGEGSYVLHLALAPDPDAG
ncbi:hypothetical protein HNR42_003383 [Deinobacterium chartae]|uniref:Helix-turn-helix domain-containing protein n=1 Tax=Deinobacterium chartae TaxID=521158 RepID=A0A841I3N5_9DEIO|nr:hypothetical protein [Deinobacterium chartae]